MNKNLNFISGKLVRVEEPVQGKNWIRCHFLVKDLEAENRNYYFLSFKEEVIHFLSRLMPGDEIQVYFNPMSSEGTNGRFYTDLISWKIYPVNLKANFNNEQE